jgi:hypothetical protein
MESERSAVINIGGVEYELLLTTLATKEISNRYDGLEKLGEKLLNQENWNLALDEIVYLITLLANQPILIHNLRNKSNPKELLTEYEVNLLTSPFEIASYKEALTEAMFKGTARFIESEEEPKNSEVGQATTNCLSDLSTSEPST